MSYNVTVDDSDSSLVYSGAWNIQGCESCSAVPTNSQLSLIYGQTYHDATVHEGDERSIVDFEFDGTAVYVYGWSVNTTTERPRIKDHDMTFMLDLITVGEYKAAAGADSAFKVLYFRRDNLEPGPHKLTMIVNPNSLALLDYIVFTETHRDDGVQDPNAFNPIPNANPSDPDATRNFPTNLSPSTDPASNDAEDPSMVNPGNSSPSSNADSHGAKAGIVAGIVVSLLLLAIAGVFFFLWWRRKRQRARAAAMVTSRTFLIDDEPGMLYIGAPGTPLSRYGTGGSSAPHTPTLQRQFLDPGTPAIYDAPEVHIPPPLILSRRSVPPPQHSPLRIVTAAPSPIPTARELPLPLGPPSEASYLTYPDTLDLPQNRPPLPPMPPIPPSPVAASPIAHGRQSVRRLVVYNAPSEVSATDENVADEPRRSSPLPPVPRRH